MDESKIAWLASPGVLDCAVRDHAAAPIGTPVRDGPLELTVHGLRRAAVVADATDAQTTATATGQFVVVELTVTNVGDWAQAFDAPRQRLIVDCAPVSATPLAAIYLTPAIKGRIEPGTSVNVQMPFDVRAGSVPEAVVLVATADSSGVIVDAASGVSVGDVQT